MSTTVSRVSTCESGLAGKQDLLTFDSVPTEGSSNPVTSGGVYKALKDTGFSLKPFEGSLRDFLKIPSSITETVTLTYKSMGNYYTYNIPLSSFIKEWSGYEIFFVTNIKPSGFGRPVTPCVLSDPPTLSGSGSKSNGMIDISTSEAFSIYLYNDTRLDINIRYSFTTAAVEGSSEVEITLTPSITYTESSGATIDNVNVSYAPYILI